MVLAARPSSPLRKGACGPLAHECLVGGPGPRDPRPLLCRIRPSGETAPLPGLSCHHCCGPLDSAAGTVLRRHCRGRAHCASATVLRHLPCGPAEHAAPRAPRCPCTPCLRHCSVRAHCASGPAMSSPPETVPLAPLCLSTMCLWHCSVRAHCGDPNSSSAVPRMARAGPPPPLVLNEGGCPQLHELPPGSR